MCCSSEVCLISLLKTWTTIERHVKLQEMRRRKHLWSGLPDGYIKCDFSWNIWISAVSRKWKALDYEIISAVTILHLRPHSQQSHQISPGISVWEIRTSANSPTAVAHYFQWLSKTNLDKVHQAILLSDNSPHGFTEAKRTKPMPFVLADFMQAIRGSIDLKSPCMSVWGCSLNQQCASCLLL